MIDAIPGARRRRKTLRPLLACWIAFSGFAMPLEASRSAPRPVPPVIHEGVRYEAASLKKGRERARPGIYIEAWSVKEGRLLWELKVYEVKYDPALERDAQDVYITSLSMQGKDLLVENEAGDRYTVNLGTRGVSKTAGPRGPRP